ncbi:hypothetical protein [Mycoplasma suis]|uniref:hypothetical protein n=1 Tax=Mycoplasma suis TaxID=57372 RepID=UPI0002EC3BD8|nr:hypothetical protein [Mycoplasma suis]
MFKKLITTVIGAGSVFGISIGKHIDSFIIKDLFGNKRNISREVSLLGGGQFAPFTHKLLISESKNKSIKAV